MTFEYLQRVVLDGQLEIENIGSCVVCCTNDIGEFYYLIVSTNMGWTEIFEYGPILPDFDELPFSYQIKYSRAEYNQGKIEKVIDKFLNDPKKAITQAKTTQLEEIIKDLVNPIEHFANREGILYAK